MTTPEFWEQGGKMGTWVSIVKCTILPLRLGETWRKVGHWPSVMAFFSHQATNEVIGRVPQSTKAEMDAAVAACKRAFPTWADTSILSRQQVLLRYQQLIKENLVRNPNSIIFYPIV